jgi:uncharacterized protein (TIGR00369 family)
MLDSVKALNALASLNRWAGFEVIRSDSGESELRMVWRDTDMGQYAGFLHAGMIAAMLDTACGFAAVTLSGHVMASNFSMSCLAPAVGNEFVAHGHVVKAGRRQVFTTAELYAHRAGADPKLVAMGTTILVPTGEPLSVSPAPAGSAGR